MAIILSPRSTQCECTNTIVNPDTILKDELLKNIVIDDTIKVFELDREPINLIVNINGLEQYEGDQYTISGTQLIFENDCDYDIGDIITFRFSVVDWYILKIVVDLTTTKTIELGKVPTNVIISINGLEQWEGDQYNIVGTQVVFTEDCDYVEGDKILIRYY